MMKKRFTLIAGILLGAITLAGCVNEGFKRADKGTPIRLTAGVIEGSETRTDISDPTAPEWSEGDAIGIYFVGGDIIAEANTRLERSADVDMLKATFAGEIRDLENGDYTIYGYYPHGEAGENTAHHATAKITIPAVQRPTATSFDAAADVMVMKPVGHTHDGSDIVHDGLQFKRTLATLRIKLNVPALAGEAIEKLTFTTDDATIELAGNAHFDLTDGTFGGFYDGAVNGITAEPTEDVYADGEGTIYLCVPAVTIPNGTQVTFAGETASYTFTKTIAVPESDDVTFTAGMFFDFNVSGTGMSVVEKDPMAYDETLANEWLYNGRKTKIRYAAFETYLEPTRNGYAFYFFDAPPQDGVYVGDALLFYIPSAKIGQEMQLIESGEADYWEFNFEADNYYYGSGKPESFAKEVVGGKMTVLKEGNNITYKLAVEFTNGRILKAKYVGEVTNLDYDELGEDIIPSVNQWVYNGEVFNIRNANYYTDLEYLGMAAMDIYDVSGDYTFDLYLPLDLLDGREIDLMELTRDWEVEYYGNGFWVAPVQTSSNSAYGKMTSGKVSVRLDGGGSATIMADIVYSNAVHLRVNCTGVGRNFSDPPQPPKPTVPITSMDQIIGTWSVTQRLFIYGAGTFTPRTRTHTMTISKVNANTIQIKDFSGARTLYNDPPLADDIRATINSNLEMVIPRNVELIPAWEDFGTSHFIPYYGNDYQEGWGKQFPPQSFGETADGEIVMRLDPNYAAFLQTGDVNTNGTFFFSSSVVWTKPPVQAAPAKVNENTDNFVTKAVFDMRTTPMPSPMPKIVREGVSKTTKKDTFSFKSAK